MDPLLENEPEHKSKLLLQTEINAATFEDNDDYLIENEIETELQIYGNDICEKEIDEKILCVCKACNKTFTTENSLKRHEERSPVCLKWLSVEQKNNVYKDNGFSFNFIEYVEEIKKSVITASYNECNCKHCNTNFSNTGNLHKHFKTATVCNQLALHSFIKHFKSLDEKVK